VWNIPTKQTMTQVLDQPYPKCVLWACACDLWTGQKDTLDCVCWWKHWYPCNKHLPMSTVRQWFQQWGLCILHVNNDDKRPRDFSEAFPEGRIATEINGSNATSTCYILKAFICCYESAFSCPASVGKLYGCRFLYSMGIWIRTSAKLFCLKWWHWWVLSPHGLVSLCVTPFLPYLASITYIPTKYALNIEFTPFCQPRVVSHTCIKVANVLNSLTKIIYKN